MKPVSRLYQEVYTEKQAKITEIQARLAVSEVGATVARPPRLPPELREAESQPEHEGSRTDGWHGVEPG